MSDNNVTNICMQITKLLISVNLVMNKYSEINKCHNDKGNDNDNDNICLYNISTNAHKDIQYFGLTNCSLVWRLLLRQNSS